MKKEKNRKDGAPKSKSIIPLFLIKPNPIEDLEQTFIQSIYKTHRFCIKLKIWLIGLFYGSIAYLDR